MASPATTALAAATLVTSTNRTGVANTYLTWINAQPVPAIAALALEGVQLTSKFPARVISNAELRYEELVDAGETGETGGGDGGDDSHFVDLETAEPLQVPVFDAELGKFRPASPQAASQVGAGLNIAVGNTIARNGQDQVVFDTVSPGTSDAYTCNPAAGSITVPYDGWYYMEARVRLPTAAAGEFDLFIGPSKIQGDIQIVNDTYANKVQGVAFCTAGDVLKVGTYLQIAHNVKSVNADDMTYFRVIYLGWAPSLGSAVD